nr:uncharacterized protein LOC109763655 isoform X2 [Aegilops tauschii subsp. strangulata]
MQSGPVQAKTAAHVHGVSSPARYGHQSVARRGKTAAPGLQPVVPRTHRARAALGTRASGSRPCCTQARAAAPAAKRERGTATRATPATSSRAGRARTRVATPTARRERAAASTATREQQHRGERAAAPADTLEQQRRGERCERSAAPANTLEQQRRQRSGPRQQCAAEESLGLLSSLCKLGDLEGAKCTRIQDQGGTGGGDRANY